VTLHLDRRRSRSCRDGGEREAELCSASVDLTHIWSAEFPPPDRDRPRPPSVRGPVPSFLRVLQVLPSAARGTRRGRGVTAVGASAPAAALRAARPFRASFRRFSTRRSSPSRQVEQEGIVPAISSGPAGDHVSWACPSPALRRRGGRRLPVFVFFFFFFPNPWGLLGEGFQRAAVGGSASGCACTTTLACPTSSSPPPKTTRALAAGDRPSGELVTAVAMTGPNGSDLSSRRTRARARERDCSTCQYFSLTNGSTPTSCHRRQTDPSRRAAAASRSSSSSRGMEGFDLGRNLHNVFLSRSDPRAVLHDSPVPPEKRSREGQGFGYLVAPRAGVGCRSPSPPWRPFWARWSDRRVRPRARASASRSRASHRRFTLVLAHDLAVVRIPRPLRPSSSTTGPSPQRAAMAKLWCHRVPGPRARRAPAALRGFGLLNASTRSPAYPTRA